MLLILIPRTSEPLGVGVNVTQQYDEVVALFVVSILILLKAPTAGVTVILWFVSAVVMKVKVESEKVGLKLNIQDRKSVV